MHKRIVKKQYAVFTMIALLLWQLVFGVTVSLAVDEPEIDSYAAFVFDMETQKILVNQNGDKELGIASITKIFGAYLVLEAIEEGTLSWDDKVSISDYAYRVSQGVLLSNVPLSQDKQYTVKELYEASVIYSANGAIIALAEHMAGSEEAFMEQVRERLRSWGLSQFHLYNISGLAPEDAGVGIPGEENSITPRELGIALWHILQEHPELLDTVKIEELTFQPGTAEATVMVTRNMMLPNQIYAYEGVDGLKTGTTDFARYSFVATAKRGNMRLVSIVLGADSNEARFEATRELLDYAFKVYQYEDVVKEGAPIPGYAPLQVVDGKTPTVQLQFGHTVRQLVNIEKVQQTPIQYGQVAATEGSNLQRTSEGAIYFKAPVDVQLATGTMQVERVTDNLGYLTEEAHRKATTVTLHANQSVEEMSWLDKIINAIVQFVIAIWQMIVQFFSGLFGGR